MKKHILILLVLFILLSTNLYSQKKYFVPDDFPTIQGALNSVKDFDTIIVRPGRYFENINLGETFAKSVKILSETNATATIIDANRGESCFKLYRSPFGGNNLDTNFIVKGFTFTNSYSNSGLSFYNVGVKLVDLIIENNTCNTTDWSYGGGLYIDGCNATVENCIIRNNKTISPKWSFGGGCYGSSSKLIVNNSKFLYNTSISTDGWAFGGGLYFEDCMDSKLSNCEISYNKVTTPLWNYGGGINCENYSEFSRLTIENSYIIGNEVDKGNWYDGSAIHMSDVEVIINNSVISQNQATLNSSPVSTIYIEGIMLDSASLEINNSSIANNSGQIFFDQFSSAIFKLNLNNSILWNRTNTQIISNQAQISLKNCVIPSGNIGTGLITQKPTFVDTILLIPSKDFSGLNKGSLAKYTPTDILGVPRPMNGLPDIGAYEVNGTRYYVKAQIYFDENGNGVKENSEIFIDQGSIIIDNNKYEYNSDSYGIFAYLQGGSHNVKFNAAAFDNFALTTNNSDINILLDTINQTKDIRYGIKATANTSKIETYLFSPPLRCQTEINILAQVKNLGTVTEDGVLYFKYDPKFKYISSSNSTVTIIGDTLLSWSYKKLKPFENLEISIRIKVPAVTLSNIDSIYSFKLWTEVPTRSEVFCYQDKIRCSFDPNDKLVNPYREDNLALLDGELLYTIRFENSGNDYAQDIVIKDVLDENLDLNTFRVINSSHAYLLETKRNGENLEFEFKNIFLPAKKSNPENCQGFVSYKIKPLPGLEEKTKIKNTANIYFDFNPPIVTNTTSSILVSNFTTNTKDLEAFKLSYYPNPTKGVVYFSSILDKIELYSIQGQLVSEVINSNMIDLSRFSEGLYLMKVYKNKLSQTCKINKVD